MITSARERPSATPSAPSTQLIGAMLAPAQIQNWCAAVEDRARSGTGSRLCSPVQASGESSDGVDRTATRTSSGGRLKPVGRVPWHASGCPSRLRLTALTTGKATAHGERVLPHDRPPPASLCPLSGAGPCFVPVDGPVRRAEGPIEIRPRTRDTVGRWGLFRLGASLCVRLFGGGLLLGI